MNNLDVMQLQSDIYQMLARHSYFALSDLEEMLDNAKVALSKQSVEHAKSSIKSIIELNLESYSLILRKLE